ncbi:MAG TPA: bifunctional phosphopantothenoylcysteine decarboxylase/phosphopantothenate--cysteine ligase CoaBC [Candidatus Sulfotelmatobacter sp.]|nr:bifunctional phosphopantothenoylcysteine decarboxylase/phosphopantothenate--cysteine ligase CoaBC [Candidatus Sulfotelmatobacter sp.]
MTLLAGRKVAIYIGGSIAAVKAPLVITELRRRDAQVRVALSRDAARFVTALSLQSLSGHAVIGSLWKPASESDALVHIDLGKWADVQLVVAASADLIARLALGIADDAVTTSALASRAPLIVVPAMETAMWEHPATSANVATLRARAVHFVDPGEGRLASGAQGSGRMAEPETIVAALEQALENGPDEMEPRGEERWLQGRKVLVTAGGTREPVDAVRYLGNYSSGKMGHALAGRAAELGAEVTLISTASSVPRSPGIEVVRVDTAAEMLAAVHAALPGTSIVLMSAAVSDFKPAAVHDEKLDRRGGPISIDLVPTVDILASLSDDPERGDAVLVGFAAETEDAVSRARLKLREKSLDYIVANQVGGRDSVIGADESEVTIIDAAGREVAVSRRSKAEIAGAIFDMVRDRFTG